jgi:hypothetical protein
MSNNSYDYLRVKKNKDLQHMSDFELVRKSQDEVDKFRSKCYWKCSDPECKGGTIKYIHSLIDSGSLYLHERRCQHVTKTDKRSIICNRKMILCGDDRQFDSIYFTELFARFQNWMIKESLNYSNIDSSDEIYCILVESFSKSVFQFARGIHSDFSNKSDKWFSSYLWTSGKNRLADLKKTKNYNKRNPLVACLICNQMVEQISGDHLLTAGHEDIFQDLLSFYDVEDSRDLMMLKEECQEIYFRRYSKAYSRNNVFSLNEKSLREFDDDGEVGDAISDSVFSDNFDIDEDIDIRAKVECIADIIIKKYLKNINRYFYNESEEQIRETVKNTLWECFQGSEIDEYDKDLLSDKETLFKDISSIMRYDNECRILLGKEAKKQKKPKRVLQTIF